MTEQVRERREGKHMDVAKNRQDRLTWRLTQEGLELY